MILKKLKPVSNSSRHTLLISNTLLSKNNRFLRSLLKGLKKINGRSKNTGRITVYTMGGGCKNLYRDVPIYNDKFYSIVITTMYNPNKNSFIFLNYDLLRKKFFFMLAINFVFPGSLVICDNENLELHLGYRNTLKNIPTGSIINNLSPYLNNKNKFIKAAGTFGQLIQKSLNKCKIRLPSSKFIELHNLSFANLGVISNSNYNRIVIGKAGRNRLLGRRPSVRGIAMNPVDHPHGGRTNGGIPSVTPWGKPTRGKPTAKKYK